MSRLIRPSCVHMLKAPTEGQIEPSIKSQRSSKKFLVSMARCCRTGKPMSRSSAAWSASSIRKVTLIRARGPTGRRIKVRGGVHVLENENVYRSSASSRATSKGKGLILLNRPISSRSARSASFGDSTESSLSSSVQSHAVRDSLPSDILLNKKDEPFGPVEGRRRPAACGDVGRSAFAGNTVRSGRLQTRGPRRTSPRQFTGTCLEEGSFLVIWAGRAVAEKMAVALRLLWRVKANGQSFILLSWRSRRRNRRGCTVVEC